MQSEIFLVIMPQRQLEKFLKFENDLKNLKNV